MQPTVLSHHYTQIIISITTVHLFFVSVNLRIYGLS